MIVLNTLSDLNKPQYKGQLVNDNLYVYEGLVFHVTDRKIHVVEIFGGSLTTISAPIEKVLEQNCICSEESDAFVTFATWNMEAIRDFHAFTKDMYIDPNEVGYWD